MTLETSLIYDVRHRLARDDAESVSGAAESVRRSAGLLVDTTVGARWEQDLAAELTGAGPLEPLLALPGVTDVLVNSPDEVYLDQGEGLRRSGVRFRSDSEVRALAVRLAASAGQRLDAAQPWADVALHDGTRLHAVLPPLTRQTTLSLRVLGRRRLSWSDLVAAGALTADLAALLEAVVAARLTVLVSGSTGSGKTTFLGALIGLVPSRQRVVTIEDTAELTTTHPHVVSLVTRSANVEGAGSIGLSDLVRQSLRMRPDRIFVGEFRGGEIVELLAALNTGHSGGGATMHANGIEDVPARLAALGSMGGLGREDLAVQASAAFDVVVHLALDPSGRRRVTALGCVTASASGLAVSSVWTRDGGTGPGAAALAERLPRLRPAVIERSS